MISFCPRYLLATLFAALVSSSVARADLIISEVNRVEGSTYVELTNPTDAVIDLVEYYLVKSASDVASLTPGIGVNGSIGWTHWNGVGNAGSDYSANPSLFQLPPGGTHISIIGGGSTATHDAIFDADQSGLEFRSGYSLFGGDGIGLLKAATYNINQRDRASNSFSSNWQLLDYVDSGDPSSGTNMSRNADVGDPNYGVFDASEWTHSSTSSPGVHTLSSGGGGSSGGGAAAPEPSSVLLCTLGCLMVYTAFRRRHKLRSVYIRF